MRYIYLSLAICAFLLAFVLFVMVVTHPRAQEAMRNAYYPFTVELQVRDL